MPLQMTTLKTWSGVALELNGIDHALDPPLASAPGPCASSYALALIHAAMADACASLGPTKFTPAFVTAPVPAMANENHFVAGAAFGVMWSIYTNKRHRDHIRAAATTFGAGSADWQAGRAFSKPLVDIWTASRAKERVSTDLERYKPAPGKHREDPLNPGQKFYGQLWAGKTAGITSSTPGVDDELDTPVATLGAGISLAAADQALSSPPPPVTTDAEFNAALVNVRRDGELPNNVGVNGPQGRQLTVGTFWAYDGVPNLGTPTRLYHEVIWQVLATYPAYSNDPYLTAKVLALCNVAMANASIVSWRAKYEHAYIRPVAWIHDDGDTSWEPLGSPRSIVNVATGPAPAAVAPATPAFALKMNAVGSTQRKASFTPNFPAYPSGHATFGGACFTMLKNLMGSNNLKQGGGAMDVESGELQPTTYDPFTLKPRLQPGQRLPVPFTTTDELISENSQSRILLGVHWDFDGSHGAAAGGLVADETFQKLYR